MLTPPLPFHLLRSWNPEQLRPRPSGKLSRISSYPSAEGRLGFSLLPP